MTDQALHEFLSRVVVLDSGCWFLSKNKLELAGLSAKGVVYRHFINDPVVDGKVFSACGNKECVCPEHLVFVPTESYLDKDKVCAMGHVGRWKKHTRGTRCQECKRLRAKRYYRKKQLDRLSDA